MAARSVPRSTPTFLANTALIELVELILFCEKYGLMEFLR
jgi:hypothetical protein